MKEPREIIGKRIAKMLREGDAVNLGIGIPVAVADYLPEEMNIFINSENGISGMGAKPEAGQEDQDIVNAAGQHVTILPGGSCYDSAMSFAIIRGGHLTATILGALQVDEQGNLANWMVPGKLVPGMGGAMDLVVGAKKVIVAMEHNAKDGSPKILSKCTLPLTGKKVVDYIVTEKALIEVSEKGLLLKEIAPGYTLEEIQTATEAMLITASDLCVMDLA